MHGSTLQLVGDAEFSREFILVDLHGMYVGQWPRKRDIEASAQGHACKAKFEREPVDATACSPCYGHKPRMVETCMRSRRQVPECATSLPR